MPAIGVRAQRHANGETYDGGASLHATVSLAVALQPESVINPQQWRRIREKS
jgi:hypothetical protein